MRRLPLLLALVVGVALWAAPSQAQESWYKRYVADRTAPGEGNVALANGARLCPVNSVPGCSGPAQAHFHITPTNAVDGTEDTNVLDTSACAMVNVCLVTTDTDGTTGSGYVVQVLNDLKAVPRIVHGDVNGDGVINAADHVPLDGDDGNDFDGNGTASQTSCLYDMGQLNKFFVDITVAPDAIGAVDNSYIEATCR